MYFVFNLDDTLAGAFHSLEEAYAFCSAEQYVLDEYRAGGMV